MKWLTNEGRFKLRIHKEIDLDFSVDKLNSIDKGMGLFASQDIYANEEILLVSTEKCITGLELVDCDRV